MESDSVKLGIIAYFNETNPISAIPIGSNITCRGKIYRFDTAENYGQFNSREYYYIRGYNARAINCSLIKVVPKYGLRNILYEFKGQIKEVYSAFLNEMDAGIMSAIMLGDKTELDKEVKELYQVSGIAHILSLSGLHIATLGLGLLKLLTLIIRAVSYKTSLCNDMDIGGIKTKIIAGAISSCFMVLYCIMTGMSISTIRALIMFILGVIASLLGRSYDLLSAAAISSVISALINPLYIYDAGFQLSFMAVISIGTINPILNQVFDKISKNKITQGILLSVSIQIGTFPIVAYHYYQVPIMGILLNLIVVPLMSVVLICGVSIAVFGLPGFLWGNKLILLFIAKVSGKTAHIILAVFDKICKLSSTIKWNIVITGKPKMIQIVVYYFMILIYIFIMIRILKSEKGKEELNRYYRVIDRTGRRFIGHKEKCMHILKRLILCVFPLMACVILMLGHREGYVIHNLSVGQGDCAIIRNKTHVIIIDCGSTDNDRVGQYRLIPFLKANRVNKIDSVFVSHFDSDHVNGIIELIEDDFYGSKIRRIIISKAAPIIDGQTENYERLINDSITCDIPICTICAGDTFMIGDSFIRCLSPESAPKRLTLYEDGNSENIVLRDLDKQYAMYEYINKYSDTNSASMVLDITNINSGYRMCFTGDIDSDTEKRIVTGYHGDYDYLKIAHHGSSSSTSEEFLDWAFPQIGLDRRRTCVISVGMNNRYGHPHKETLYKLYSKEAAIYRTDQMGECVTYAYAESTD